MLAYGIEIEDLIIFPQNSVLLDHFLITFEFLLPDHTKLDKSLYTRCLSDSAIAKFKEDIPTAFDSLSCLNITEDLSPSQIDTFVDGATICLRTTLDSLAPLKKKMMKQRKLAPWYNSQTRKLKQISRNLESGRITLGLARKSQNL